MKMNNEYDLIFHLHNELIDAYNINRTLEKHINELNNKIDKLKEHKKKIREYVESFEYYIPEDNIPELLALIAGYE